MVSKPSWWDVLPVRATSRDQSRLSRSKCIDTPERQQKGGRVIDAFHKTTPSMLVGPELGAEVVEPSCIGIGPYLEGLRDVRTHATFPEVVTNAIQRLVLEVIPLAGEGFLALLRLPGGARLTGQSRSGVVEPHLDVVEEGDVAVYPWLHLRRAPSIVHAH